MAMQADAHADLVFHSVRRPGISRPASLLPSIDVSWQRCLQQFNLDPARNYEPYVLDSGRIKDLQEENLELVDIARAEMDALYQQISGSGIALLLANTQGVILAERMDPTLHRLFDHAGLIVGAEWSERREGTNGIGTCVAEHRPVTIHGTEHFRSRHTDLSCSAAPIYDPNGRLVAVLDASSVGARGTRESQAHTVTLVSASARLIEKHLFLSRHSGATILRFHYRPEFVDLLHDGALAVSSDGIIVGADRASLQLLGTRQRGELVGRPFKDVFNASYDVHAPTAELEQRHVWELQDVVHGNRFFARFAGQSGSAAQPLAHQVVQSTAKAARKTVKISCTGRVNRHTLEELAGDDPMMLRNVCNAHRVLNSDLSILLKGATGTGKEAFARAMHHASTRAQQPFIAVNCAALPESLIESELFGYGPGAFTGARRDGMRGRIVQASGGTLFLDEIGDMPLLMQTRLLRVLEDQEVGPLGSEHPVKVELRVISASHRNLSDLVKQGQFREDLFYRLNGIALELPALAQRRDKDAVIRRIVAEEVSEGTLVEVEAAAYECLLNHSWPGNFRELRNTVRAAIAICDRLLIRIGDLPPELRASRITPGTTTAQSNADVRPLQQAERQALLRIIDEHHGNMTRVATALGTSRNTLYRKLKRHGIGVGQQHRRRP